MVRQAQDKETDGTPLWLTGIVNKRPECLLILHALVVQGLRTGTCTAEDAHGIYVTCPNVRGAAMKLIGQLGFEKEPVPIKGSTEQSHGHWLHVWRLIDRDKAERFLRKVKAVVVNCRPEEPALPGF